MKKIILLFIAIVCMTDNAMAGEGDQYFNIDAGLLYHNTLCANIGYEKELEYGNAWELYGEAGNKWTKDPICGHVCDKVFWKDYYWDCGLIYKKNMSKGKNNNLRMRIGPQVGAYKGDYFFGAEVGFEYNICLKCGWQISIIQKNQVNFKKGDPFRNGILIGTKIPF